MYGQSAIEGGTSVYKSSNVVIHDNYLQGGYPARFTDPYTGAGIVLSCSGGNFNRAYDNQIVDWTNVRLRIVAGHDNSLTNNRVISDGKLGGSTHRWRPRTLGSRCGMRIATPLSRTTARGTTWSPGCTRAGIETTCGSHMRRATQKPTSSCETQVTNSTELNEYKRSGRKAGDPRHSDRWRSRAPSLALRQSQSRRNPLFHRTHRAAALHLCLYYYNARRAYSSLENLCRPRSAVSSLLWGMTPNRDERRFGEGV